MRKQIAIGFLIGLSLTLCILSASKIDAATKKAQDVNYPIYIDNVIWTTSTPVLNVEGSTYLPLRAMSEALGVTIEWSKEFRRVDVYKEKKPGDFEITGTPGAGTTTSDNSIYGFINSNYKNNMNLLGCETAVIDTSDDVVSVVYIKGYNSETKAYEKQIRFDLTDKIYKEYVGNDSTWVTFDLNGNVIGVSCNASPVLDTEDSVYQAAVKSFKENINIFQTQILGGESLSNICGMSLSEMKSKNK